MWYLVLRQNYLGQKKWGTYMISTVLSTQWIRSNGSFQHQAEHIKFWQYWMINQVSFKHARQFHFHLSIRLSFENETNLFSANFWRFANYATFFLIKVWPYLTCKWSLRPHFLFVNDLEIGRRLHFHSDNVVPSLFKSRLKAWFWKK